MRVLSFGEILFDIIEGEHYLGGAPLNFAGHLARLGADSYILSAVGADALGAQALKQIAGLGVKTDMVQIKEAHPTGTVPVTIRNGQPDYEILENVAYDFIDYKEEEHAPIKQAFDVLYYGTLAQRSAQSRSTLRQLLQGHQYKQVFYDINLRKNCYNAEVLQESLRYCSMLKLNDDEVRELSEMFYQNDIGLEAFARRVAQEYQLQVVIITAGAKGCYVLEEQELHFVKGYPAKVVDTVGAGDSFSAAFVFHYLKTGDPVDAADKANQLGAYVASSRGPLPEYTAEIKKVLKVQ